MTPGRLYELLPALYRVRDHAQGEPLRALLAVIEGELERVDADVAHLYENWFIETCDEWVVPYIGDLLRVRPIRPVPAAKVTTRGYVANTLAYRRRKGTAAVLEQLARDTTGWPAKAVEFFATLVTTAHMNHVRPRPTATPAIRDASAAELASTPFDPFGHTLEVRRIGSGRGRYNIPNVGIFLWRLQSYPVGRTDAAGLPLDLGTARAIAGAGSPPRAIYTFNPIGLDAPLFNDPDVEETITGATAEEHVPAPIRRLVLATARAFRVLVQWTPGDPLIEIPRDQIYRCEIPDDVELASPPIDAAAVDPERGRLSLTGGGSAHRVYVTYHYGSAGDLGGGPYDRTGSIDPAFEQADWQRGVSHLEPAVPGVVVPALADAIAAWNAAPGRMGVIALLDSVTDGDPAAPQVLDVHIPAGSRLLIVGAGWPAPRTAGRFEPADVRPHVIGDLVVHGGAGGGARGRLAVNGLLVEGSVNVETGALGELDLAHSTIAPGRGELIVAGDNRDLRLLIRRCVTGPVRLNAVIAGVAFDDCLVGAPDAGASPDIAIAAAGNHVAIERSTVWGAVNARVIDGSNSIFTAAIDAERRQEGCVRFSFVPPGSRTARRHRCQPETAVAAATAAARGAAEVPPPPAELAAIADAVRRRVVPAFESRRYGDPDFGLLTPRCAIEIRLGADTGSAMGAWSFLDEPHREANLRTALDEYLRFGLEAGVFFVPLPRRKERR